MSPRAGRDREGWGQISDDGERESERVTEERERKRTCGRGRQT